MSPSEFLAPLFKQHALLPNLQELLSLVVQLAIENGVTEDQLILQIQRLDVVLLKLPTIDEPAKGKLTAPIACLIKRLDPDTSKFWYSFLSYIVSFVIPDKIRFEHTHVLGATGAGKTQLLQQLIYQDIQTHASVVVMAPKGTLIENMVRVTPPERLIHIDPSNPLALNVFKIGGETNNAVSLINYVFSSILGTGISEKQTSLLNYCVRLLLLVPDATVITLRDLLLLDTLPQDYLQYVDKLSDSAQHFFRHRFSDSSKEGYRTTKRELQWRLDLLLENTVVEKIFSQPETQVDILRALEGGKVMLIDTSERVLGQAGSSFLGRFLIALIAQASQQRTKNCNPAWVYIDEATSYLDETVERMLERARESRIGFTIAHQQLAQLRKVSTQLEAAVMTNTSTKFVGGCSHDDARALEKDTGVPATLQAGLERLHFFLYCKGFIPARPVDVRAGFVESLSTYDHPKPVQTVHGVQDVHNEAKYTPDVGTGVAKEW